MLKSRLDLKNVLFDGCQIFDCDFLETNLTKSSFENSDLKNSLFHQCNLSFVSFINSVNYKIDPNQNTFKKTKFSMPEVVNLLDSFDIEIE